MNLKQRLVECWLCETTIALSSMERHAPTCKLVLTSNKRCKTCSKLIHPKKMYCGTKCYPRGKDKVQCSFCFGEFSKNTVKGHADKCCKNPANSSGSCKLCNRTIPISQVYCSKLCWDQFLKQGADCIYCGRMTKTPKHEESCYKNPKNITKRCLECNEPLELANGWFCNRKCQVSYGKAKPIITDQLCEFGCGKTAQFTVTRKRRLCCCTNFMNCSNMPSHSENRFHQGWYKGIWCASSWELAIVLYLLDHRIPFTRCKDKFTYVASDGKHKTYNPDFKVYSYWVEVKGPRDHNWSRKKQYFPHPESLIVIDGDSMPLIIKYAREHYPQFPNLFEAPTKNVCKVCEKPCGRAKFCGREHYYESLRTKPSKLTSEALLECSSQDAPELFQEAS